jgi:hypothetical protein
MTAARIIEALGSLLWPLLLAVVVLRVVPHLPGLIADLRHALRTRAFKVKIGGAELSVEEATEQLRRQVTDLQTQMAAQLAERGPARAAAAAPAPRQDQGRPTILWVAPTPGSPSCASSARRASSSRCSSTPGPRAPSRNATTLSPQAPPR